MTKVKSLINFHTWKNSSTEAKHMSIFESYANKLKKDGVDHIRVSVVAETQLGKICAHDWRKRFFVPRVGDFLSPVCFANWLVTGDEEARHDPRYKVKRNVRGYHKYVLFAKFYQLCSLRGVLVREMKDLPFVAYKVHQSGIKEFDRWKDYPLTVKEMVRHVIDEERGPKVPFPFDQETVDEINSMIAAIAGVDETEVDEDDIEETTQELYSGEGQEPEQEREEERELATA